MKWDKLKRRTLKKNETEINDYIDNSSLIVLVSSSYFDFDDYENPIKSYIDTKFYYNLDSSFTKTADIYVRKSFAEQSDSIFQFQPSSSQSSFISAEDSVIMILIYNIYLIMSQYIFFIKYY